MKIKKSDIPAFVVAVFPDYRGRKFRLTVTNTVTFYDTNWSGGTRNQYRAVRLRDAGVQTLPEHAPWDNPHEGQTIDLPQGYVIVCHQIFCGHDMGLTVHAHPNDIDKLLTDRRKS